MSEIKLTEENFEMEVLKADTPVLVDFWASWCPPCMKLAPIIEEIAKDYEGKVKVGKVNVDENPKLAASFRVANIPTLIVFKDGKAVNMSMGYMPKEEVEALLK